MADEHRSLRLVWVVGLLVLVASTAGTAWYLGPWSHRLTPPPEPTPAAALPVVAQGHVDVRNGVVPLFPSQPGRVVKVLVHEGDTVSEPGAPLIELDSRLAQIRKAEAEAAWKAAVVQEKLAEKLDAQHALKIRLQRTAVKVAEQNERSAEANYQYVKKLYEGSGTSDKDLVAAETQRERARAAVETEKVQLEELEARTQDAQLTQERARAEVAVAKARLDQAQLALEECVLRAPRAGKVLRVQAAVGDVLGTQPLQPAITFAPDEPLIVRAEVDQEDVGRVHVGDAARVMDDTGTEAREWEGRVIYVSDWLARKRSILLEPGQLNDVRTLECIIKLEGSDTGLRIGQRVRVNILPSAAANR